MRSGTTAWLPPYGDALALTPEDQRPIEEAFDFLLKPWATSMSPAFGGRGPGAAGTPPPRAS